MLVSYSNAAIDPEALVKSHFKASKVIKDTILLTAKNKTSLSEKAQTRFPKSLYRVIKAVDKKGNVIGYGLIDSHIVRTKTQALLFYYNTNQELQAVELLAFQEPDEYKPKKAYLEQTVSSDPTIPTGATLTYSSIEKAKKRTKALAEFYIKAQEP